MNVTADGGNLTVYYEATISTKDQIHRVWIVRDDYDDVPVGRYLKILEGNNWIYPHHVYLEY